MVPDVVSNFIQRFSKKKANSNSGNGAQLREHFLKESATSSALSYKREGNVSPYNLDNNNRNIQQKHKEVAAKI